MENPPDDHGMCAAIPSTLSESEPRSIRDLFAFADTELAGRQFQIAVEALLFDEFGRWILMRRGEASRDGVGKLEGIGGMVEAGDASLRDALSREIREEAGGVSFVVKGFFEVRFDCVLNESGRCGRQDWIIVSYLALLGNGDPIVHEPERNLGYVRLRLDEVDRRDLSPSARAAHGALSARWAWGSRARGLAGQPPAGGALS